MSSAYYYNMSPDDWSPNDWTANDDIVWTSVQRDREKEKPMIPPVATLDIRKEEAERMLELYADVPELTEREQRMLALYDAVLNNTKVIDLSQVMEQARDLDRAPSVVVAPIDAELVKYTRTFSQTRAQRKQRRADMHFSLTAGDWSLDLGSTQYRTDERRASEVEAEAYRPSVIPTHRAEVKDGDLMLWEPVWSKYESFTAPSQPSRDPDPAILRPLGHGLYQVVAAWNLTAAEMKVLGS